MLCYCKRCGWITDCNAEETDFVCDCCGAFMFIIPSVYMSGELNSTLSERDRKALMKDLVLNSPESDPYLINHREEIMAKKQMK